MPQITQLDNDTTPNNNDLLVTVDVGAGTTKNISREQFFTGAPLPADTVDEQAIADGAVTAGKTAFGGSYSTSEVDTGFTWVDGKPIYKQTFTGTITAAATTRNITNITVSGIENLIRASGYMATLSTGAISIGSSWTNASGTETYNYAGVSKVSGGISLINMADSARTNQPYAVTIEYTKV